MIVSHTKEIRIKKKLSQKQLSELNGVSKSYISELENNTYCPSILTVCKLADALEVDINDLFTYKKYKKF